jgi:hypothetical protein
VARNETWGRSWPWDRLAPAPSGSTSIETSNSFSTRSREDGCSRGSGRQARQLHFFIAEEGITAALPTFSVVGSTWSIEEFGDRDPPGARVGAILQALIAREPVERRPSIRAWLPPGFLPPQVTIISAKPSTEVMMVRSIGSTVLRPRLSGDDVLYWRSDIL